MEKLSAEELINLIKSVFPLYDGDRKLGILVDVPRDSGDDTEHWSLRRKIADGWYQALKDRAQEAGLEEISLFCYPDVGSNNADLPAEAFCMNGCIPETAADLKNCGAKMSFDTIFTQYQLFLAPTQYSATAPLKNAAKKYNFRAATMPGFSPKMIAALRIDYNEVFRRVQLIKDKVDPAEWAKVDFLVDKETEYQVLFDLRHRNGHLSPGRFPDKGVAGNLPSGETYIVPYEGEQEGQPSKTNGTLPVQMGEDVILFTIKENVAIEAQGYKGEETQTLKDEIDHLKREPAYGNMAELGFGILGDFGLEPINEILLDEKLGFHVAFGRSDHFGGQVGPKDFSSPQAVIHLDQIYIPATQPRVAVKSLILGYPGDKTEEIIKNNDYLIF